ncbi:TonB-linked outer membrane protein, SusC/RagA family [Parapedobacter indicus]|uniref:TonB-linked outer membrane protein, SusC/RagA family n=2 Tax=Parapedobacter indicus TaxID=1477437 RepID=A0A1I3PRJ3_9SPHI|nr:TonB-linked SusC/RagA family outer membrane protein [Parapedobacter indicus]SFJ24032.1 TonB-linked outer membrane protein, SusC/RagA family [Parapedobacter indicus]
MINYVNLLLETRKLPNELAQLFRIMRITTLLLFIGAIHLSAATRSQTITLRVDQQSLPKVFESVESQTGFLIVYNDRFVKSAKPVTIVANRMPLEDFLQAVLTPQALTYQIKENTVLISRLKKINSADAPPAVSMQQQRTLTGKVTDESGRPLAGVTVSVKGTSIAVTTDVSGEYRITIPSGASILVFTSIGFDSLEHPSDNRQTVNASMKASVSDLDEVVVVGYGTVRKSDLTGSVASVKAEELQATPITSLDQGLVGRASGVMVTQTSGMPGAIASIRIRGSSSLQGGNEPLYVIDGFPIYNGSGFGNTGGNARMSGLSAVNPSDIESIEILKDASATAIYGSRAANGVVLITTKKGKRGEDRITFDVNYGIQNVVRKIDVMNAYEYAQLVNEAYMNDGLEPVYDDAKIAELRSNPTGTDWQEEVFQQAPTQSYQLNIAGGNDRTMYSVSGNYYSQDGVIRNSYFDRYQGRVNLERDVLKNVKIGTHLNISRTISNATRTDAGGQQGVVSAAMKFNPIQPVYSDETLGIYTPVNIPGIIYANPVASALERIHKSQTTRFLGDMFAEWAILPDLKAKVSFGTDLFNTKFDTYVPAKIYESNGVANATITGGYNTNWLNENTLTWTKEINEVHNINVLGGLTFQRYMAEGFSGSSQGFVNDILGPNSLGSGSVYNQPSSDKTEWSLMSYLGRVNYGFKDRYLFSISGRVDGSSRFGANNKFAFFPSGSFAWRVIEEPFWQPGLLSDLKLRVSYGVTGNQEIGLYRSLPTLTNNRYTIGRALVTGFFPNIIPNPDLKWERTGQFDVGVDVAFFDNRLRLTSDFYQKRTTDLIYDVTVPFVSGYGTSLQNIGSVVNNGWELAIEGDPFRGDFSWSSSFNISFNRNKVLELGGESYKDVGTDDGHLKTGSVHRLIVGKPMGLFYGYQYDGLFRNEEELAAGPAGPTNWLGGRRYKDISGPDGVPDGKVDATYDRAVVGDPNPDFFGGFTNTFSYRGLELNVFLQYSYGNDIFNYNAMELELPSGGQNVYQGLVDRWTPQHPDAKYPKATTNRSAVFSNVFIEDASYLKIKTITMSYTFSNLKLKYLNRAKVYVTGQNLFAFTNYKGYDPEVSYRGASNLEIGEDFGGYPMAKTFLLGVQIDL